MDESDICVLDPDVYGAGDPEANGLPHEQYAWLRDHAPLYRQEIHDPNLLPWTWVVSRYDDVVACGRDHRRLASGRGVTLREFEPTLSEHGGKEAMITMDGEAHVRNRRIVARGLSPSVVRSFEQHYRELAGAILDAALAKGTFDFVEDVATELPLRAICELMGVPPGEQAQVLEWSNTFSNATDPEYSPSLEAVMGAVFGIWNYGLELAERRRRDPGEDMMSKVVAAVDDDVLSEDELMGMTLLMAGAGNETTRNALSHGLNALMRHPDQMQLLRSHTAEVMPTAVEEILRWSSPVVNFRRTAVEDIEMHGRRIAAGERVTMLYASANHDPRKFPDPLRFDLTRDARTHVAFGVGPHVCMGAAIARLEIRLLFEELLNRTTTIEPAGGVAYARDSFLRGVKRLPVTVTAR